VEDDFQSESLKKGEESPSEICGGGNEEKEESVP
jgi:hypothetical protein